MAILDVERILTLINNADIRTLKAEDFDIFQYQGFNPMKIVESLLKVKNKKSMSDAELQEDIMKMVAIGQIKGNITEKNKTKMSDEGQTMLNSLQAKYDIKYGGGKNQPSSVITFPRITATFPDLAVKLAGILGPRDYPGGPFLTSRLPAPMRVQVFPSIVPKSLESKIKTFFLKASLCYSVDQTHAFPSTGKKDPKQLISIQAQFVLLSHNSIVPKEEVRTILFKSLSFTTDYNAIVSVLTDYKKYDNEYEIPTLGEFTSAINALTV
jgi:hypothetical protein